jgi:hypothetical protein
MNDIAIDSSADSKLADLERRLEAVETKVAAFPDVQKLEEHITERVKASMPPPVEPAQAPSFKDIALPIPSVDSLVSTAKATWTLFEMVAELKLLFWTLLDRRYHMAWLTRVIVIVLLAAILTSQWWLPFAWDNIVGRLWEKIINLVLGFVLFFVLHFEMRRYQEWLKKR